MIRHLILITTALSMLAAAGCVNMMSGTVDDQTVGPARTALFAELDTGYPDAGIDGNMLMVVITGLEPDVACDATKAEWEIDWDLDCVEVCLEAVANAEEYLTQAEYWQADLSLLPAGDAVATYEVGDVWDMMAGDPMFSGGLSYTLTEDALDNDFCLDSCANWQETQVDHDWWEADGGTIEIATYTEGEALEGTYAIEFEGDLVEGDFAAEFCDFVQ